MLARRAPRTGRGLERAGRNDGPGPATRLLKAFERFLADSAGALRRRLGRHATHCPCLGRDEALLAQIVRSAGQGDRESARAIAADIMREADLAAVIESAARLGKLLGDAGGDAGPRARPERTLH